MLRVTKIILKEDTLLLFTDGLEGVCSQTSLREESSVQSTVSYYLD
jgi:hypothetical protein